MTTKDFVIIGGSIAGLSAIKAIRESHQTTSILWITNEDRLPYKRTKINKGIGAGFEKEDFALIDNNWLINNHIELLYDHVQSINPEHHELTFQHRGNLRYKKLILATGNTPNQLKIEGLDRDKILPVYTAHQAENIIRSTAHSKKYLIIGAGVEGVETAEQLIKLNKEVVLIDSSNRLLSRFFTPYFSDLMKNTLEQANVKLILNVQQLSYQGEANKRSKIIINQEEFEFDTIISSIGYTPNTQLARDGHIACNKGILVNEYLQTSTPDIYAAGDVAEHSNGLITGLWHAAEEQGFIAGKNSLGIQTKLTLLPFRMKTEVFNEFYFAVPPHENNLELISEEKHKVIRHLYFKKGTLVALLMKNDKERAKMYQKALMEQWNLSTIHEKIPL
jgi:NAD(P)H-nitrite reductase large subunit